MNSRMLLAVTLVLAAAVVGLSIAGDAQKPAEKKAGCTQGVAPSCCSADASACCSARAGCCSARESAGTVPTDQKSGCSSGVCPITAMLGLGKTAGSGCASGGCASPLACSDDGCPGEAECASGRACAAKLTPVVCPVSGEVASRAIKVAHNGGEVYFRCGGCKAKFERDPQKFAAKANLQLVSTGQAVQVACPVSGGKVNKDVTLNVAGVDVGFFCAGCRGEVAKAEGDRQVQLVFGNEAFEKSFKIKKRPAKAEQAEPQQASQQVEAEKPEKQANKEQPEKTEKTI